MTRSERIEVAARALVDYLVRGSPDFNLRLLDRYADAVRAAIAPPLASEEGAGRGEEPSAAALEDAWERGHRAGVEAAAKVAEDVHLSAAWSERSKYQIAVGQAIRALSPPSPSTDQAPGEGGPCRGCREPFDAKAEDVVWDGNGHSIGVATCPRCQYPALVKIDPAPSTPAESEERP